MAVSNQQSRDAALLRATTELFALGAQHDADEIRRFEELATHFLGKVSPADRAFVAERLSKTRDAPGSVLRMLGKDLIEIASPILRRSAALSEIDLLSILSSTGPAHHRLIAQRPNLPLPVVHGLRIAGDGEVAALLAHYPSTEPAIRHEPDPAPILAAPAAAPAPPPEAEALPPAPAAEVATPPPALARRPMLVPAAPRDPEAREVFAVARAMTAALSFEMTSLATVRPEAFLQPPAPLPVVETAKDEPIEEESPPVAVLDVGPAESPPAEAALPEIAEPLAEIEPLPEESEPVEAGTLPSPAELREMDEALETSAPDLPELGGRIAAVPAIDDFLALDARGRFEALARLLGRAGPADPGMTVIDADNAFRVALGSARVSQHTRRRQRDALIRALAEGLRLDIERVTEIADDPSGEALVVLVRAIGLSESEAHQVLLFANPAIAEAVETFFRLARLSSEIGREAAEGVVASWRGDPSAHAAGHQPYFAAQGTRHSSRSAFAQGSPENRNAETDDWRTAG